MGAGRRDLATGAVSALTADSLAARAPAGLTLPAPLLERVLAAWSTPGRAYHDLGHLEDVLRHFDDAHRHTGFVRPREAWLALLFHDAVYVPGAQDNEARSAELARGELAGLPLDRERVAQLVLLTARHGRLAGEALDADAALFLDCDLAILGAAPGAFDAYDAGIAAEHRHVPKALYAAGRRAFLEGLLGQVRLFASDWGRARFEGAARANLARALRALAPG